MIQKTSTFCRAALLSVFLLLGSFTVSAHAKEPAQAITGPQNLGLGIIIGEPTGLSAKLWTGQSAALDFGLSFSFDDYLLVWSDYLFHFSGTFKTSSPFINQLVPYIGVGGLLAFSRDRDRIRDRRFFGTRTDSLALGLRVPFGIEWTVPRPSLGVFVELVPGITLIPSTSGLFEGGIGVRYYF